MNSSFKTRPNTYSLDLAPSSQAKCRVCKGVIRRGDTRIVTHAFVRPGRSTYFVRHASCATAAFVACMLRAHGSIEGVPADSSVDAESAIAVRAQLSSLLSSPHVGHEAVGVGHHVVPPTSGQVQHVTWSEIRE